MTIVSIQNIMLKKENNKYLSNKLKAFDQNIFHSQFQSNCKNRPNAESFSQVHFAKINISRMVKQSWSHNSFEHPNQKTLAK
jgi:hypothetical protein